MHEAVDDATRLAHVELLADEKGPTMVGLLSRAVHQDVAGGAGLRDALGHHGRQERPAADPMWIDNGCRCHEPLGVVPTNSDSLSWWQDQAGAKSHLGIETSKYALLASMLYPGSSSAFVADLNGVAQSFHGSSAMINAL